MKSNPKISIIIPTFNEEKNIARLLLSIENQSVKSIETIVVDDGSTDATVEIAKKYCQKVYQRQHAERSVQRNFGASKANGKYLLFVDADMELSQDVIKSCLQNINDNGGLIISEKTVGSGFVANVRKFERKMYMGDPSIEVARFFPKQIFVEFNGYDKNLTGTEDYDLPKRISTKYAIGWAKEYISHHETGLTIFKQLTKKYYYARKSTTYVEKHPDLISKQGILIFRRAYLIHWKEFVFHPILGFELLFLRTLETISATMGFVSSVGLIGLMKAIKLMFKNL